MGIHPIGGTVFTMITIEICSWAVQGRAWPYYRLFIDIEDRTKVTHALSPNWLADDIRKDELQYCTWMKLKNGDKRAQIDFNKIEMVLMGAVATYPGLTIPVCSDCKTELFRRGSLSGYPLRAPRLCRCERGW